MATRAEIDFDSIKTTVDAEQLTYSAENGGKYKQYKLGDIDPSIEVHTHHTRKIEENEKGVAEFVDVYDYTVIAYATEGDKEYVKREAFGDLGNSYDWKEIVE